MYLPGGRMSTGSAQNQLVAEHDLSARRRNRFHFADNEVLAVSRSHLPPDNRRIQSPQKFCQPDRRICAATLERLSATILQDWSPRNLTAPARPASARTENSTIASFCVATPPHARWWRCATTVPQQRKVCANRVEWRAFPLRLGKTPVLWLRLDRGPGHLICLDRGFEESFRVLNCFPARNLDLPLRRCRQMREPASRCRQATAPPAKCPPSSAPTSHGTRDRLRLRIAGADCTALSPVGRTPHPERRTGHS